MIDLHTHSCASDGSDTPSEIAAKAAAAGLTAVALTDHDTVEGIPEFLQAARAFPGLTAVPGVELSCSFSVREVHLVGLFIDPESESLQQFLASQRQSRDRRNRAILAKLACHGYPLSSDDPLLQPERPGGSVGRPHFARALVAHYGFPSMQAVFDKLLKHGAACFVPRELPEMRTAIEAVHGAGGVAVWAHPIYRERNEHAWARRVIKKFTPPGLDAVEGYYSMFGPNETAIMTELAAEYGLALSGGSDYHGSNMPNISLGTGAGGLHVPDELLELLRARRSRKIS